MFIATGTNKVCKNINKNHEHTSKHNKSKNNEHSNENEQGVQKHRKIVNIATNNKRTKFTNLRKVQRKRTRYTHTPKKHEHSSKNKHMNITTKTNKI